MKYEVWVVHNGWRAGMKKSFVKSFDKHEDAEKYLAKRNKNYLDIFEKPESNIENKLEKEIK